MSPRSLRDNVTSRFLYASFITSMNDAGMNTGTKRAALRMLAEKRAGSGITYGDIAAKTGYSKRQLASGSSSGSPIGLGRRMPNPS